MNDTSQQLRQPTNRTVAGPRFRKDGGRVVVEYDYERDDGGIEWSQIVFNEVLTFGYRQASCCREEDIAGTREVRCLVKSKLLSEILKRWQESVGWQEWQQEQGGGSRFKHFTVFFDDAGCIDVIARSYQVV